MGRVRNKDTKPELAVRSLVHSMGYRYRLHSRVLPGQPDLVFVGQRKVIFIHGCFWHQHKRCPNCCLSNSALEILGAQAGRPGIFTLRFAIDYR